MKKTCICCKCEKELSEFYVHPAMKDGHLNKCKECCKRHATERRNSNLEEVRNYDRNRPNKKERTLKGKEYKDKMRQENPEKFDRVFHGARKTYRKKNKDKTLAESKLDYAIKNGIVIRPDCCSVCGVPCKPQGHHFDYSKPLDVIWVCSKCHSEIHKKIRDEKRRKETSVA